MSETSKLPLEQFTVILDILPSIINPILPLYEMLPAYSFDGMCFTEPINFLSFELIDISILKKWEKSPNYLLASFYYHWNKFSCL